MAVIREGVWNCTSCSELNRGRDKACRACGSVREKDELVNMRLPKTASERAIVKHEVKRGTDLHDLFTAGADWFCSHCGAGNRGDGDRCSQCGAPSQARC